MRRWRLALIGVAAALAVLPLSPALVERVYSAGAYPRLQPLLSSMSSVVPVALLDIAAALLVVGLIWRAWRWKASGGWLAAAGRAGSALMATAAVLYLWFLIAWGFNYRRVPLEDKLAYDAGRITRDAGVAFARHAAGEANRLRAGTFAAEERRLAAALQDVLRGLGGERPVTVTAPKRSLVELYFRRAAIDGMTVPFFLEIVLNPDLLPSERPFVLAHEWAHLAGYADESEANYIAWLACVQAGSSAEYSGWLAAYQQVTAGLPAADRRNLAALLTPPVTADLAAERERYARSSPVVRAAARGAYDAYLRANRVEEGIASYNAVVRLMLGTTYDRQWVPRMRHGRGPADSRRRILPGVPFATASLRGRRGGRLSAEPQ